MSQACRGASTFLATLRSIHDDIHTRLRKAVGACWDAVGGWSEEKALGLAMVASLLLGGAMFFNFGLEGDGRGGLFVVM